MDKKTKNTILNAQRNEITEHHIYKKLAKTTKDYSFKKRFWEMALISLGIAALSFLIGLIIRTLLPVEI